MSKHTKTPWFWDDTAICGGGGVIARIPNHPENGKNWKNDADHIVHSVNALPGLVKALEEIEGTAAGHDCRILARAAINAYRSKT